MRLIDADVLRSLMNDRYIEKKLKVPDNLAEGFVQVEKLINEQPTVDAKPVVHGKWEECGWVELDGHGGLITYPKEGMRCSNCNRAFKKVLLWTDNFCPNCGASMEGE